MGQKGRSVNHGIKEYDGSHRSSRFGFYPGHSGIHFIRIETAWIRTAKSVIIVNPLVRDDELDQARSGVG